MGVRRALQTRDYRRFDRSTDQLFPIETGEPLMALQVWVAVLLDAYPLRRVLFAETADQIHAVLREYRFFEANGVEPPEDNVICLEGIGRCEGWPEKDNFENCNKDNVFCSNYLARLLLFQLGVFKTNFYLHHYIQVIFFL